MPDSLLCHYGRLLRLSWHYARFADLGRVHIFFMKDCPLLHFEKINVFSFIISAGSRIFFTVEKNIDQQGRKCIMFRVLKGFYVPVTMLILQTKKSNSLSYSRSLFLLSAPLRHVA